MATITATKIDHGTAAIGTTMTTASITLTSGKFYLACIRNTGTPGTVSATGWSVVNNVLYNTIATPATRLTILSRFGNGVTAGVVFTSTQSDSWRWSVIEITNVDAVTPIRNSATDRTDAAGSLTVTLPAFDVGGNSAGLAFGSTTGTTDTFTPEANWTELDDLNQITVIFRADTTDNTAVIDPPGTPVIAGISLELKNAVSLISGGGLTTVFIG